MNLYYSKFVCSECGETCYLSDGAQFCPHCAGQLYRARSGRRKTVAVCRTVSKVFLAIAGTSMLAAIVMGSAGLFWFAVTALTVAAGAAINAHEEGKKTVFERRKV